MNEKLINWLLDGEPWVEYRTRLDLLDQSKNFSAFVETKLLLKYIRRKRLVPRRLLRARFPGSQWVGWFQNFNHLPGYPAKIA